MDGRCPGYSQEDNRDFELWLMIFTPKSFIEDVKTDPEVENKISV
jgi:hypothetical protein